MRLSLVIVLLSVIISAVFSAPAVPLRGTLKDVSVEGSSSSSSTSTAAPAPKKTRSGEVAEEAQDGAQSNAEGSGVTGTDDGKTQGKKEQTKDGGSQEDSTDGEQAGSGTGNTNPNECGTSFVMWFGEGTPVATLKCGEYTIVYAPESGKTDPAPKYISGDVKAVTFENSSGTIKIKVDGKELSTLSTDSNSPTENSGASEEILSRSRSRRSLTDAETTGTVDVLAFTLQGGKRIEVAVPNASESSKRDKYSLVADDKPFYTGTNSGNDNGIYRLDKDGNLADKDGKVLLKDAAGSAFGFRYIVPSVFAILAALFMM